MKSEAIVMTVDFVNNYFNAIHLGKQLKLISKTGNIITIPDDNQKMQPEGTGRSYIQLIEFFKAC